MNLDAEIAKAQDAMRIARAMGRGGALFHASAMARFVALSQVRADNGYSVKLESE